MKHKAKAGDVVCVRWADAVSYPRVEAEPSQIPLPEFDTYGIVGYVDRDKIVLLHEHERDREEVDGVAKKRCIEPTALPMGMIRCITIYSKSRR